MTMEGLKEPSWLSTCGVGADARDAQMGPGVARRTAGALGPSAV